MANPMIATGRTPMQQPKPIRIFVSTRTKITPTPSILVEIVEALRPVIRDTIRSELRAERDIRSWISASPWMTQEQACEYLQMSRTTFYVHRKARKLAKTAEGKNRACAPDHGQGTMLRFHRDELDAWLCCLTEF